MLLDLLILIATPHLCEIPVPRDILFLGVCLKNTSLDTTTLHPQPHPKMSCGTLQYTELMQKFLHDIAEMKPFLGGKIDTV